MQAMSQRMERIQARLHQFDQSVDRQLEQVRAREQERNREHAQQAARVSDPQRLQQMEQERERERLHEQAQVRQHERLREMSRSMDQVAEQARRNMARVGEMTGDAATAGDRELQREMERLEAHWGRIADELEDTLRSMEQVRNRIGQS